MPKLTLDELKKKREEAKKGIYLREGKFKGRITVHLGTCGIASGARDIVRAFIEALETNELKEIKLITSGCAGLCSKEPMATVEMLDIPPVKYGDLTPDKAKKIIQDHVLSGEIVTEFAIGLGSERGMTG
ncbi:MAG: (2Fe-2S) ferredoxin domain-containing protein [Deltaproteobacteria bacterium]|nr:(2Fe-2S) ferredoxin domain-containing protein [Deltaproteobacteria bacterium]NIS77541.1 (2Fe-2S) ferredoxin domain-containing protein [Deltaproteobacteria bacterium]